MSYSESDTEREPSSLDTSVQIPPEEIIEPERDNLRSDSTINPIDDENQFLYDDEVNRLLCIGTNFSDIPESIIDTYSLKTKVKDHWDFFSLFEIHLILFI